MNRKSFFSLLVFFLFTSSLNASNTIWLVAGGDLRGEIKPCGCSPDGDMGGLLRRATYLQKTRNTQPKTIYLDFGNNFPTPNEQGYLKVELIQNAFSFLKPDAILLGPSEVQYGISHWDQNLPYFVSNQLINNPWKVPTHQQIQISPQKTIQIWGYLSPQQIYQNSNDPPLLETVHKVIPQWQKIIKKSNQSKHILMFRGDPTELEHFAKSGLFDLILTGSNNDDELNQVLTMKTASGRTFLSIPTKGQGMLEGNIVNDFSSLAVNWLLKTYTDAKILQPEFQKYDEAVKDLFFANLDRMDVAKKESHFVGNAPCQACHLKAFQVWEKSSHANAFATLEKEKKQFDPECIVCHTVGFQKQGFLSAQITPQFKNVQCENCHGSAKQHLTNPQKFRPSLMANQECVTCHQGSHSPQFKFSKYWPKIAH